MKSSIMKYSYLFIISLAVSWLMSSCVDDKLNGPVDPNLPDLEGSYIGFKMDLPSLTRAGEEEENFEKYDDYIDPEKLQILFFYADETKEDGVTTNKNYNKLIRKFSPEEIYLIPIEDEGSNFSKKWYVLIPVKDYDFGNILRQNNFKIAALVNWTAIVDLENGEDINKLHHQTNDWDEGSDVYFTKTNEKATYDFLTKDGNFTSLGNYSNWVKNGKKVSNGGNPEAENFIRQEYGPGRNTTIDDNPQDKYGYYKYDELWWKWNFNGALKYNTTGYNPADDYGETKFAGPWAQKNNSELQEWLAKSKLEDLQLEADNCNFHFYACNEVGKQSQVVSETVTIGDKSRSVSGIHLGKGKYEVPSNNNIIAENVFGFQIPNNGKLIIKWGAAEGTTATLYLENRNHPEDSESKDNPAFPPSLSTTAKYTIYDSSEKDLSESDEIKITGDPEYLYIYSPDGNAIIYEIEYLSDYYIQNIDNRGKTPKETNIPMYGIQEFEKLTNWKEGTVFDLSNYNNLGAITSQIKGEGEDNDFEEEIDYNYNFKNIWLLRSVAKVELKIPKSLKAHHVYLRCMNRKARCEPLDVSTPTNILWEDKSKEGHDDACGDWGRILGHVPFYDHTKPSKNSTDRNNQWESYREKLSWYYGIWANGYKKGSSNTGLKLGEVNVPKFNDDKFKGESNPDDYPHIMNAMIERTDFVAFTENGSDAIYDRYVLYVPDKYVDDPGSVGKNVGMESTTPKVCHIEFRGGDQDPYTNIDDNWCFRIYFTEGGFYGNPQTDYPDFGKKDGIDQTWENIYEQNEEKLKHHWPIIRNHLYSFTVTDANSRIVVTRLEVLPWRMVEDNHYSW